MRRNMLRAALIGGLLTLGATAVADEPRVSGELMAYQCAGCHGFNGHSVGPDIPSLAGFPKDYFVQTMTDYKEGRRPATVMNRVGWGYSVEDFEAMGDFFAAQPFLPAKQDFDAALAERGAAVHDQNCSSCHSAGGTYPEPDSAQLAGQWIPYLRDTFEDFLERGRPQPRGMQRRMEGLSAEDREALFHYYASQQDPAAFVHN
jgi:cytochrome subunit of sulfide dehydrogenase